MKRLFFIILLLPALAFAQFGHVGMSASQMLAIINPAIADSGLFVLDDADTTKPKAGRYLKVPGLLVTGGAKIEGNVDVRGSMTLDTTPVTKLTADSTVSLIGSRNEGGVRAKNTSMFGATTTPVYITSTGKLGIRTATPYASASIVDAAGGSGTGLHLVNSAVNKARTTWATSHDSASIALYTDTDGTPRLSMRAKDGDSTGIFNDGSESKIVSSGTLALYVGTNTRLYATATETQFPNIMPLLTDTYNNGSTTRRWKDSWFSDNIYLGGKGQTATMYVSQENTIAGQDSSIKLAVESGEPVLSLRSSQSNVSGTATQNRRLYSGADTTLLVNGAKTGRDSTWAVLPSGRVVNNGVSIINKTVSLADQAEYTPQIPAGMCGWGTVQIGDDVEWARFRFKTDGTVTLEANSTNVGTTNDTDTKLNIYDAGTSGIIIENQLGSTLTCAMVINAYTP